MSLIQVTDLVKVYPGDVRAVDEVGFEVERGEIFGFLGPNGAGKTTTIRILVTLLAPTSGSALIDGIDVVAEPELVRERVGYAAQAIGLDSDLTGLENVVLQARLHGLPRRAATERAHQLLEIMQLTGVADRRAGTYSGGMRRRLDLAQALAHEPELLFLDEPTTGLDPQNRRALWGYLRDLNERGVTVFLTTQYMEEADALAHRLAIIDAGRIAITGTPQRLKAELGGDVVTMALVDEAEAQRAADVLARFSEDERPQTVGAEVRLITTDASVHLAEMIRLLDGEALRPERVEMSAPTLDDVFLRHTGAELRVEEVKPPSRMPLRSRVR